MKHGTALAGLPLAICIGLFATAAPIPRSIIRFALYLMKFLGLFRLARHVTRHGLRIICYHGFAVAEEYKYRSTLFIRADFFRKRVEYLRRERYPILPLRDALDALAAGRLPPCATVITMDDGWRGVYTVGLPIIRELKIPVTVYVTTYYVEHRMPVYTVTVSYLFWRATPRLVDLPRGIGTFDLECEAEKAEEVAQKFGAVLPPDERLEFLRELAAVLDVSFDDIEREHLFEVMDEQQLRDLAAAGVDIQLHSHRHQWPLYDKEIVESEIAENRRFLQRAVSYPLEHFCYPSGVYGLHQAEWLAELGVKSATTIEPGLNYRHTSHFALRRLVDGGPVSDIEFDAEMTGFMEVVRLLRRRLRVGRGMVARMRGYQNEEGRPPSLRNESRP
ncbi:MAG: polysaccharide deacetylase family protein [Alphaproteobacteria bacterium]|nr:polysaccharide deacetylase family protein [Alphaproteobacteria bacterium]